MQKEARRKKMQLQNKTNARLYSQIVYSNSGNRSKPPAVERIGIERRRPKDCKAEMQDEL
jgi:uncharacterized metal-binding protein